MKKYLAGFLILFLLIISSFLVYMKLNEKQLPPNLIMGTGRIDGDLININTKYSGRIEKLFIEEGSSIKKGQIIAKLSSKEYEAQLEAIKAQIRAKEKQIQAKKTQLEILKETLPENVKKAKTSLEANNAKLRELNKNIDALKKVVLQDEKDYKRFKNLFEKNLIPAEEFEKVKLKYETDRDKLKALIEKRKQILSLIKASQITLNQAKSTLKKIDAIKKEISALLEGIKVLKAKEREISIIIEEFEIKSPVNGYIVDKVSNEGEVLGAGMTIATAIDPDKLYLKMYVDTIENGKIKIGDIGEIFLDAYPDKPIKAVVIKIAKKAEFTPKEVAVREDRIQRVFAVYLKPIKPDPLLKLGLPAIGIISIDGKGLPSSLKELPEL